MGIRMKTSSIVFIFFLIHLSICAENQPFQKASSDKFSIRETGLPQSIVTTRYGDKKRTFSQDDITTSPYIEGLLKKEPGQWKKLSRGGYYKEVRVGKGNSPKRGTGVFAHFKLRLDNGQELENTFKRRIPYSFTFGYKEVIEAFEECVDGMKKGGKRTLIMPASMLFSGMKQEEYHYQNQPIKPDATLIFDISLCWLREPEWDKVDLFK